MSTSLEMHRSGTQPPTADVHTHKGLADPHESKCTERGKNEANSDHFKRELKKQEDWINHPPFCWEGSTEEVKNGKYVLECFCKQVQFTLSADPLDVKICHCGMCKKLHGAPMQAAAVFQKTDARLTKGFIGDIVFFSPGLSNPHMTPHATPTPRKLYCARCGCPLADEGKNMFIAYPSSIRHWKSREVPRTREGADPFEERMERLPEIFNVRKHIFYGMRALDMPDGLPKWEGLDGQSRKMDDDGNIIEEPSKDLE